MHGPDYLLKTRWDNVCGKHEILIFQTEAKWQVIGDFSFCLYLLRLGTDVLHKNHCTFAAWLKRNPQLSLSCSNHYFTTVTQAHKNDLQIHPGAP